MVFSSTLHMANYQCSCPLISMNVNLLHFVALDCVVFSFRCLLRSFGNTEVRICEEYYIPNKQDADTTREHFS